MFTSNHFKELGRSGAVASGLKRQKKPDVGIYTDVSSNVSSSSTTDVSSGIGGGNVGSDDGGELASSIGFERRGQ